MKITTTIEYNPAPEELAAEFCSLYEDGQAKFFNRVAEIFNQPSKSLAMQLEYISRSKLLSGDARYLMRMIGDYSEHNK